MENISKEKFFPKKFWSNRANANAGISDELETKTGLTLEASEQKIVGEELGSALVRSLFEICQFTIIQKIYIFSDPAR